MVLRRQTKTQAKTVTKGRISQDDLSNRIQQRAYQLFERRGYSHGSDWSDWFEAERQVKRELRIN